MDVVDRYVSERVVTFLGPKGILTLEGNREAVQSVYGKTAGIEAKMALISDQWTDGGITHTQFDRQNRWLMGWLDEARAG